MTFPDRFQTARLILRPLAPDDAGWIFADYAQDPDVTRYLTWRPHETIADTHAYIARSLTATDARVYVITRQDGTGCGGFDLRRTGACRIGFGYVLARACWGQGLMTEALTEVAAWALGQPDIWRIGDICDVENLASARVMENAGLLREGVLRRWAIAPNLGANPRDYVSYARVR